MPHPIDCRDIGKNRNKCDRNNHNQYRFKYRYLEPRYIDVIIAEEMVKYPA
jgi:hypothetical protein